MKLPKLPLSLAHYLGLPARLVQKFKRKKSAPSEKPGSQYHALTAIPKPQPIPTQTQRTAQSVKSSQPLNPEEIESIPPAVRARCRPIIKFGMENGCINQACTLAFESTLSAEEAIATLRLIKQVDSLQTRR